MTNKKTKVVPVTANSIRELCEKIEKNINDGGFSWDGRWSYDRSLYQAIMTKTDSPFPNSPGPK